MTLSVESIAVNVDDPAWLDATVKVTTPDALDVPDGDEIVSFAPRLEVKVTDFPETRVSCAVLKCHGNRRSCTSIGQNA